MEENKDLTAELTVDVQKYLDRINELEATRVPVEDFNKLKEENATLFKNAMNRQIIDSPEPDKPTVQELRNKLYSGKEGELSQCEYLKLTCDLRDALLEETGIDYMAPTGTQYEAVSSDYEAAQKFYDAARHCLEIANGDDGILIRELDRITIEAPGANIRKALNRR